MTELSLRKLAASIGWSPAPTREASAFSRVAVASNFHLSGGAITLEGIEATLDRSHLRGRAAIDSSATPMISLDLHVDAINLDDYRAPVGPTAPVAKAAAAAPTPLPFAALRALDAHGSIAIDRASVSGLPLSDVHITLTAYDGNLRIVTSAKAFGGTATGDAHLDASHEPASLALTEVIRSVDVGAAVKAYAKSDRLSGAANAEAKLAGSGTTYAALIDTLAGPIDVEIKNGALEGLDVPFEIEQAQALWRGQAPPSRSGPARTPFNVLSARSRFGRGVLMTDALQLETQVLKLAGKGTFRLSDQAVAYELIAHVQEIRAASGDAGVQRQRSLEIPIAVTGTVHDYKVRPDVSNIVKDRVELEIEKHKGELRDKLTDKLKELFPH